MFTDKFNNIGRIYKIDKRGQENENNYNYNYVYCFTRMPVFNKP